MENAENDAGGGERYLKEITKFRLLRVFLTKNSRGEWVIRTGEIQKKCAVVTGG